MKHVVKALIVATVVAAAYPAWGVPQGHQLQEFAPHPAAAAGISLAAAAINVVYFPARLVVTTVTAAAGGLTGWLSGGDRPAARSIWDSTEGQAFITPDILEGRERLRFGQ